MRRLLPPIAVAVLLAGCAATPSANEAERVALRLGSDAPASACALLSTQARRSLTQDESGSCAEALAALHLPRSARVVRSDVYGHHARVVLDEDTVFLVKTGSAWQVSAAHCTDQGADRPYHCQLEAT